MMNSLSVIIITKNEEHHIADCLDSVSWANEIIVVDAMSTDRTVDICNRFPCHVIQREWTGFAGQKQYALARASHDWVLSMDADERVTPDLAQEIRQLLQSTIPYNGYRVARRAYFLGKWIRHCGWYPGYQVRLFRKSKTHLSKPRVHEGFVVDGPVGNLTHDLIHYSHPTLTASFEKMNRYSGLEAMDRISRKQVKWYHLISHPVSEFLRKYVVKLGFLDGCHGLVLCLVAALNKMVLYMKIWELQQHNRN